MEKARDTPGEADELEQTEDPEARLFYKVDDNPPWYMCIFFGLQITITNLCFLVFMAVFTTSLICADAEFSSKMFTTTSVMSGLTTMAMNFFGARLPIFQGPSFIYILPYMNAASNPKWGCNIGKSITEGMNTTSLNGTGITMATVRQTPWDTEWKRFHGPFIIGNAVEALLGFTGAVALLGKLIRPITIAIMFIQIAIYLWEIVVDMFRICWAISIPTTLFIFVLSMYLHRYRIPLPSYNRKKGCTLTKLPLFELFPVLIGVLFGWLLAFILTEAGALTDEPTSLEFQARTDIHAQNIDNAPAIRIPYPGQHGAPWFGPEYLAYMVPLVLVTMIESVADYSQYSVACGLPPPPRHAVNRGIMLEGLGGILAGFYGTGHATSSYSNMMGVICVTKVASRLVYITGGLMMIIVGVLGKLGAVLVSIPQPVLAGPVFIGIALMFGSAFVNLTKVKLTQPRNQANLGVSIFLSIMVSFYIKKYPSAINTGSELGDGMIHSLLDFPFLLGAVLSCFLEHTLPNPDEDTYADILIDKIFRKEGKSHVEEASTSLQTKQPPAIPAIRENLARLRIYDPPFIGDRLRAWKYSKYFPIFPQPNDYPAEVSSTDIEDPVQYENYDETKINFDKLLNGDLPDTEV